VPYDDEGRALFGIEDGELLSWLGAETDEERGYVEDERTKCQIGWSRRTQDERLEADEDES